MMIMKKLRELVNFRLILSLGLLGLLFVFVDWQTIISNIIQADIRFYLLGLCFYFMTVTLWALRWYILLISLEDSVKIPYLRVFRATIIGVFYSLFLPKAVGTDVGRIYEIFSDQKPDAKLASTVLLDRIIGLLSLVIMSVVSLVIGSSFTAGSSLYIIIPIVLLSLITGWLIFFNRTFMRRFRWIFQLPLIERVYEIVLNLYQSLYLLQSKTKVVIVTIIASLVMKSVEVFSTIFIALAIGVELEIQYFFIFLPIIWVISMIPISVSGLGLRESAFVFFFTQVGVSASDAVTVSLLYYSCNLLVGVIGGGFLLHSTIFGYSSKKIINSLEQ